MMRTFACLALVGCLAPWLLPVQAASAIRQPTDLKETELLIQQLGDKQFPLRTQALTRLEKMGPSILPQLRTALGKSSDPEARRHLEALIPKMEQQVALEPTRITLNLKDVSLTKAAEELSKQSGYKLDIYRNGGVDPDQRLMTLQVQNATFWEAVGKLCEVGGYTLHEYYGPDVRTIRLMPGDHYPGTLYLSGAFRIMLRGFYHYRTMDFSNGRNNGVPELRRAESLSVNFSISAEPKMPLLGAGYPTITDAVDDQGQSIRLPPQTRPQQTYYHGYRSYMHNVQAQLGPSANGKRLKVLKGTIPVTVVATQRPQITIEKLADVKNQTFKQGTTTLFVESVSYNGSQTHIKMNITESSGRNNGRDHSWSQTVLQRMEVIDEKGNKLQNYGGTWNGGMNSLQGTIQFGTPGNSGKGVKLVLYEWATVTHNVPFEFEDVPLP